MIEQSLPTGPAAQPGPTVRSRTAPAHLPPDALSRVMRLAARLAGHPQALELLTDLDAVAQELSEYQLAAERLRFLSEAGELLGSPTDIRSTLQRVARLAVPRLADACAIYLLNDRGGVRQVAGQHADPDAGSLLADTGRGFPALARGSVAAVTLETGQAILSSDSSLDLFTPRAPDEDPHDVIPPASCASMTVPMRARGRNVGLLYLTTSLNGRRFTPADLDLARELADRAALAVDNASLFRQAEETRAQLDSLISSTPVGLALLDRKLRIVRVNDALARMLGSSVRALTGRRAPELDPGFAAQLESGVRRLIDGRETLVSMEVDATPRGALERGHWLVTLYPVRTRTGHYLGLGAAVVDITSRKEAELAARAAREAAEAASHAKSQFLGVMSHELRTPLTTVIGYADLLLGGMSGDLGERQREQIRRIKSSAWHLVGIIEEILTFSRAEAGKEEVHLEVTDLAALALEAAEMIEPQARSRGLEFRAWGTTGPQLAFTDGGKIRQILLNLLGNAVKFTETGRVELELQEVADGFAFHIRDTGPGIHPEHVDAVFEPFRQIDQSSTRKQGGTGLGLTVSRHLARMLGGDVTVASQLGTGSVFTVRIPGTAPQSATSTLTVTAPSGA